MRRSLAALLTAAAVAVLVPGAAVAGGLSASTPSLVARAHHGRPFRMPVHRLSPQPAAALPTAPAQAGSFWSSPGSVPIVALLAAALLGLAAALLLAPLSRRAVHHRVETFIAAGPEPESTTGIEDAPPRGRLAAALVDQPWWPDFVEQVEVGRLKRSPENLVRLAIVVSLVAAVLGTIVSGTVLVAFPLLLAGPLGVRMGVRIAAKRQRSKFGEQLPAHLQDLAGAMRAGRSIVGALAAVTESADEPIRGELERALADERLGLPLEQSLNAIGRRMHSEDIEQVALIASLHRRSGSNVAEALDRVADGARERADMRRELSAMTGQARISSWVLTALPPLLLFAIVVIAPSYARPLLHTVAGFVVLVFAGLMVVAGWFVMKKIVRVEV